MCLVIPADMGGQDPIQARRPAMKYVVTLTPEERTELERMVNVGKAAARKLIHARILLMADRGPDGPSWESPAIAEALGVGTATVDRVRRRFVEEGLESALVRRKHRRFRPGRLDGDGEAQLTVLACSKAPAGRSRWTLRLLAETMTGRGYVEAISYETVRRTLKKTS